MYILGKYVVLATSTNETILYQFFKSSLDIYNRCRV